MRKLRKRFEFDVLNTIEAFACICGCHCAPCSCSCVPNDPADSFNDKQDDTAGESVTYDKNDNKIALL